MEFVEEQLKMTDKHQIFKINEMANKDSIYFFFIGKKEINNETFGAFETWQGLKVDNSQPTMEACISTSVAISFVANTLLKNLFNNNLILLNNFYRIEKLWSKGDKFEGNKLAKGHGFEAFLIKTDTKTKELFKNRYIELINNEDEKIPF